MVVEVVVVVVVDEVVVDVVVVVVVVVDVVVDAVVVVVVVVVVDEVVVVEVITEVSRATASCCVMLTNMDAHTTGPSRMFPGVKPYDFTGVADGGADASSSQFKADDGAMAEHSTPRPLKLPSVQGQVVADNGVTTFGIFPQAMDASVIQAGTTTNPVVHPSVTDEAIAADARAEAEADVMSDMEAAAVRAAGGFFDQDVISQHRAQLAAERDRIGQRRGGVKTSFKTHVRQTSRRLEIKLISSKLFKDKKAVYPFTIDDVFVSDRIEDPAALGNARTVYVKNKTKVDSEIVYTTLAHKIDRATCSHNKDDVLLLSNSALFVISYPKAKLKCRIP